MTINVDQWFETSSNNHVRHENHLPASAEMFTESEKEDRSNGTRPPDVKAIQVAPDRNNNNNIDSNMLDSLSSEDDDDEMMPEWHYNMSDEDYDSYYHNGLFLQYNNPPTPKRVHNQDLAPITLLVCDTIQNHDVGRPLDHLTLLSQ